MDVRSSSPASSGLVASIASASGEVTHALGQKSSKDAARKFEALLATQLVKEMRKALPEGFFGDGADGDIYAGWLDQNLGNAIAKSGSLHLAPMIEKSIDGKVRGQGSTR